MSWAVRRPNGHSTIHAYVLLLVAPRGEVPPQLAKRMRELADRLEHDRAELQVLIVEALKAGGSTREVAAHCGLSGPQVHAIGKASGWPSPEQKAAREAERLENERWARAAERARRPPDR